MWECLSGTVLNFLKQFKKLLKLYNRNFSFFYWVFLLWKLDFIDILTPRFNVGSSHCPMVALLHCHVHVDAMQSYFCASDASKALTFKSLPVHSSHVFPGRPLGYYQMRSFRPRFLPIVLDPRTVDERTNEDAHISLHSLCYTVIRWHLNCKLRGAHPTHYNQITSIMTEDIFLGRNPHFAGIQQNNTHIGTVDITMHFQLKPTPSKNWHQFSTLSKQIFYWQL